MGLIGRSCFDMTEHAVRALIDARAGNSVQCALDQSSPWMLTVSGQPGKARAAHRRRRDRSTARGRPGWACRSSANGGAARSGRRLPEAAAAAPALARRSGLTHPKNGARQQHCDP